jgi:hypothetical protein
MTLHPCRGDKEFRERWRDEATPHLQTAIAELECAVAAMPVSYERLLLSRALQTCTLSFGECSRNLDVLTASGRASEVQRSPGARP